MFIEVTELYFKYDKDGETLVVGGEGSAVINSAHVIKVSMDVENGKTVVNLIDDHTTVVKESVAEILHELNAEFI